MSDERIEKIEWATTQPPYGWLAKPALEVIQELQADLRERDSQDELWRLVNVWRTRADEEYQRAEAAETRERALRDALEAIGTLPDGFCVCPNNRDPKKKPETQHVGECQQARAALAQQPADREETLEAQGYQARGEPLDDQPAQGEPPAKPYHQPGRSQRNPDPTPDELYDPLFEAIWQTVKGWDVDTDGCGYHGATGNEAAAVLRAVRNAQGERLDPRTLERAAQVVLKQGFRTSPSEKAAAIRNLRGDT